MQATNRVTFALTVVSVVTAALLVGAVDLSPANSAASTMPVVQSQPDIPMVGVATGEFYNGLAVYRLPAVAVTETRSHALARIAKDEALAMK